MKILVLISLLFCSALSFGQSLDKNDNGGKILLDNDKVRVVEFIAQPQNNVCGKGMHFHKAHLTVTLTDAKVLITSPEGDQHEAELAAEKAMWFDAGTHSVVNAGIKETRILLIYLK